ncbi:hypothetical protein HZA99_01725 [Candidatus Woesearchaeota archaeon]|nr:hypothetical protein [Candidatus Woesearchaeota archaeon]
MKQKIIFITLVIFLLIITACSKEKTLEKSTPPVFNPSEKPTEKQENPVNVKQKLTVIDEEGRALEVEVKEE